ncbi:heparinase II/III family protein [Citreimonas salinaria]|uniref:Uncharacterized conserved protein, heparinase superfamily n=1 Tax=Citreimonas salinaria TaxID=321339 RepID=A0A1H3HYV1_9RHOB|nr:heparinase II/III family protein [Citreimonas salinaria]SDY20607.1 Uncharacterized conserved protein, heparinase superfamily [Citreimonas salinaria]
MARLNDWRATQARWLDRLHARLAARAKPSRGFTVQPEPRTIGFHARGRQLIAGNLLFAGHLVEAPDRSLWDVDMPDAAFRDALHGFTWLDDLAAVGDVQARTLAQAWVRDWIDRYGRGSGPGWTPELTGRRMIRLVHHGLLLLRGADAAQARRLHQVLAAQTRFLSARTGSAPPGLPRFEALTGELYGALTLEGLDRFVEPARRGLAAECARRIDWGGGLPSRNPEDLLDVFTLLTWAQLAFEQAGRPPDAALGDAIARMAPTLRALRHADGGLARFHGGGRGAEGRLDAALAASGVRRKRRDGLAMGFSRLAGGRTTVIADAAPPPSGRASAAAHASTLAFELTSGRRPLIVNCGAGDDFGEGWRRAGRASPSHSTLCLNARSSARLVPARRGRGEWLAQGPGTVPAQFSRSAQAEIFEGGHDGYVAEYGLTHARCLSLGLDGRSLRGEDYLVALDEPGKRRFAAALGNAERSGLPFRIHFHLHPDVDVALETDGTGASMALRSGEMWGLRFDGAAEIAVEPSVYLEHGRLQPRATKQVVLSGRAMEYATRVRWTLEKTQDTALAVRDLVQDEADEYV